MCISGIGGRCCLFLLQWNSRLSSSSFARYRNISRNDSGKAKLETWVLVVIVGTLGLLATLVLNLGACLWLAFRSNGPAFPPNFDQRFLILAAWGFMVPFVWGFNAKWLPVLSRRPSAS